MSLPPISESQATAILRQQNSSSRPPDRFGATAAWDQATWLASSESNRRTAQAALEQIGA